MRIKMSETTRVGGQPLAAGQVLELADDVAEHLVASGLAVATKEKITEEAPVSEPTPEPIPEPEPTPEPTPAAESTGASARRTLTRR